MTLILSQLEDFDRLVHLLEQNDDLKLILAAIGLRRLLLLDNPPIQSFIDANLIPKFIQYLSRHDLPKLRFEAAWCLANIASGSKKHVSVLPLLGKRTIDAFVQLLASPHAEVIEKSIQGLGNLAENGPKIRNLVIEAGAVEPISALLD